MSGRLNSFSNFRCLGYTTVNITGTELDLSDVARPNGCNGAFIRLIANAAMTGIQPIAFFSVPVQPTPATTDAAPDAVNGMPLWNTDMAALWPGQLNAKFISGDGLTHTARIQWVALT